MTCYNARGNELVLQKFIPREDPSSRRVYMSAQNGCNCSPKRKLKEAIMFKLNLGNEWYDKIPLKILFLNLYYINQHQEWRRVGFRVKKEPKVK